MSLRKETAKRNYYAWIGHETKRAAEKEAKEYRAEGQKCVVQYDKSRKEWHCWRWHDKKR